MYEVIAAEASSTTPMRNIAKEKLFAGNKILGTFFELGGASAVECLAKGGFDYIIIDTEHGPFSVESTMDYIRVAESNNITPFVRIGEITRPSVLRMLDIGAKGLIIPNIHNAEEVRELVRFAKFAPLGQRGYCPTRTTCWGADACIADAKSYMELCNEQTLLFPQCETVGAYENIEEIVAIEGVAGIFVGPADLSIALGVPLDFSSPKLKSAIMHVLEVCKKANKVSLIFAGSVDAAREWFALGFDSVCYSLDAAIFVKACKEAVLACKGEMK